MSFLKQMEELDRGEAQIRRENEIVQELREKYFKPRNFVQLPSAIIVYAFSKDGEPKDILLYCLLYQASFSRKSGDFSSYFKLPTLSKVLGFSDEETVGAIKRLKAAKHIKALGKESEDGTFSAEFWLSTRVEGNRKFVADKELPTLKQKFNID